MPTENLLIDLLPQLFTLKGNPYSLEYYKPFWQVFSLEIPRRILIKAGRQVSKSTTLASRSVLFAYLIPFFSTFFLFPLRQQATKFSSLYVKPFITHSPIIKKMVDRTTVNNVMLKTFKNGSALHFSYVHGDPLRIRGTSVDQLCIDEVQDVDLSELPIYIETLSASKYRLQLYTGTPKTTENTIEQLWQSSSQSEWVIRCEHCNYDNIASIQFDLERMIGEVKDTISLREPATICAKCGRSINPLNGHWEHRFKNKIYDFIGLHMPQIIFPHHFADKMAWKDLILKQQGFAGYTIAKFYNEVLGESYDVAIKLITKSELLEAACLDIDNNPSDYSEQVKLAQKYQYRFMGVDWGGYGEENVSQTAVAVVGCIGDRIDVIYGEKLFLGHTDEIKHILKLFKDFKCHVLAHDVIGRGVANDNLLIQAGIPAQRVYPIQYHAQNTRELMAVKPTGTVIRSFRPYFLLNKTRSLMLLFQAIKAGYIKFFKYNEILENKFSLLNDFLSLIEEKREAGKGMESYFIIKSSSMLSDDFAHAVNFACCSYWYGTKTWPTNIVENLNARYAPQDLSSLPAYTDIIKSYSETIDL